MSRTSEYQRLSVAEKQARHRQAMREPAIPCPHCDTQTTVADLLRHVETCPGRREPHPLSEWVGWREALALGVLPGTLSRWVRKGKVRTRGEAWRREYLRRDLAKLLAARRGVSERKLFPTGN
jgi:hypothetical protein